VIGEAASARPTDLAIRGVESDVVRSRSSATSSRTRWTSCIGAVPLGVARHALDELVRLAGTKVRFGQRRPLAVAEAEAALDAVQFAHRAAGTAAIGTDSVLTRCLTDTLVATRHVVFSPFTHCEAARRHLGVTSAPGQPGQA
jgi:hypothetical protein